MLKDYASSTEFQLICFGRILFTGWRLNVRKMDIQVTILSNIYILNRCPSYPIFFKTCQSKSTHFFQNMDIPVNMKVSTDMSLNSYDRDMYLHLHLSGHE